MTHNELKVKLTHDTIVAPANEPRGVPTYGKSGETHVFERFVALSLEKSGRGELVSKK